MEAISKASSNLKKSQALLLTLASILVLLTGMDQPGLGYDSIFYALNAREFLKHPEFFSWALPDHPPLVIWLQAGIFKLFGASDSSARILNVCLAWAIVWMSYRWVRIYISSTLAVLTAMSFFFCQPYLNLSHSAYLDFACLFFILLSFHWWSESTRLSQQVLIGFFLTGALLSKGALAFIGIGALILSDILCLRTSEKKLISQLSMRAFKYFIAAILLALFAYGVWKQKHLNIFSEYWTRQNSLSSNDSVLKSQSPNPWNILLLGRYLATLFPWSLLAPFGFWAILKDWKQVVQKHKIFLPLAFSWGLFFAFYAFTWKNYYHYLIMVIPMTVLLAAYFINSVLSEQRRDWLQYRLSNFVWTFFGIAAVLIIATQLIPISLHRPSLVGALQLKPWVLNFKKLHPKSQIIILQDSFDFSQSQHTLQWYWSLPTQWAHLPQVEELAKQADASQNLFVARPDVIQRLQTNHHPVFINLKVEQRAQDLLILVKKAL